MIKLFNVCALIGVLMIIRIAALLLPIIIKKFICACVRVIYATHLHGLEQFGGHPLVLEQRAFYTIDLTLH